MKNLRNDYCIRMFTGSGDNLRPCMNEVSLEDNGYLYATNAHVLAKIKAEHCTKDYKKVKGYPNAESVMIGHKSSGNKTFMVDELFKQLMLIEICFKPKMIKCEECEGHGLSECHCCGNESECKECEGKGKVEGEGLELSGENKCTLYGKKYNLDYVDRVIKTAIILGEKTINISNDNRGISHGTIFTVGDFKIMLMPTVDN